MNYAVTIALTALLLFSGCVVTQETGGLEPRQELVRMSPLPPLASSTSAGGVKVRVMFKVLGDGTVAEVRVLKSSGDAEWDASAIDSMKRWRFSTIPQDTVSAGRLFLYLLVVRAEAPVVMTLGELVAAKEQEADSLYALLKSGVAFDAIAKQIPVGSSGERGRFLGPVNIAIYPEQVRDELRTLSVNDFTHPIRLGHKYVIYLRFENDGSRNLVP
jgi:TonB family protein